jgi:hypothetical protein
MLPLDLVKGFLGGLGHVDGNSLTATILDGITPPD